ncbi:DUF167 domain-containing protein [Rhodopila globiformis]|uniref:UPF0235 protein CCS01_16650 n=1 Tax=Rhodopila globiformis TaxID=1071 RepID=A0A2S6NB54_RHOGL|nr:DUF167 family protein [Rhodopila globiformis]PPQ31845.1 hypothetical protein CCS01_16650 [Rhodopila globiformis]
MFWCPRPDGVNLTVKVQPKSRRPGIQGRSSSSRGPCLRIGVSEAAEDGRANRAACTVLAQALDMPASAVTVTLGQTSRDKILHVAGDVSLLKARLEAL